VEAAAFLHRQLCAETGLCKVIVGRMPYNASQDRSGAMYMELSPTGLVRPFTTSLSFLPEPTSFFSAFAPMAAYPHQDPF